MNPFAGLKDGLSETARRAGITLHNMERNAFGGAGPNSRQLAKGG
jgi:hypothetical protein